MYPKYKACILLQATRNSLLPPFIRAFGPLADVLGSWYLGQLVAKYQDLTAATDTEKVLRNFYAQWPFVATANKCL